MADVGTDGHVNTAAHNSVIMNTVGVAIIKKILRTGYNNISWVFLHIRPIALHLLNYNAN